MKPVTRRRKSLSPRMGRTSTTETLYCIACKRPIREKPRVMMLQITSDEPRFLEKAKKLGFTSSNWRAGNSMKGSFHKNCFDLAKLIWQVAFETRAVSPRR